MTYHFEMKNARLNEQSMIVWDLHRDGEYLSTELYILLREWLETNMRDNDTCQEIYDNGRKSRIETGTDVRALRQRIRKAYARMESKG